MTVCIASEVFCKLYIRDEQTCIQQQSFVIKEILEFFINNHILFRRNHLNAVLYTMNDFQLIALNLLLLKDLLYYRLAITKFLPIRFYDKVSIHIYR